MKSKNEILANIIALAQKNNISLDEIKDAFNNQKNLSATNITEADTDKQKVDSTMKLFSYLGAIFILSGISVYISMFWSSLNSVARIILTLGTGMALYVGALLLEKNPNYRNMITPLFLLAALFIPMGLLITIHEFSLIEDVRTASLIVFGVMLIQQLLTFWKIPRTVLIFTSIFFAGSFYCVAFDLMNITPKFTAVSIGLSLLCLGYGLNKTSHQAITPLIYLVGSIAFLFGAFDYLQHTRVELLYLVMTCYLIYLSALQQSRTLLFVSTCALLSYISYFTSMHFVNSVGWPITLVILGCVFYGVGTSVLKLHRKYTNK